MKIQQLQNTITKQQKKVNESIKQYKTTTDPKLADLRKVIQEIEKLTEGLIIKVDKNLSKAYDELKLLIESLKTRYKLDQKYLEGRLFIADSTVSEIDRQYIEIKNYYPDDNSIAKKDDWDKIKISLNQIQSALNVISAQIVFFDMETKEVASKELERSTKSIFGMIEFAVDEFKNYSRRRSLNTILWTVLGAVAILITAGVILVLNFMHDGFVLTGLVLLFTAAVLSATIFPALMKIIVENK